MLKIYDPIYSVSIDGGPWEKLEDLMLTLEGGTGGWYSAFKMTCKITGMEKLLEVYISLNWMNSDYFDEYICDHIMTEIFDNTAKCRGDSSYSTYLRKKGWI